MRLAIVFDLDGTLVDSAPDIAAAVNIALAELDKPPLLLRQVTGFIGNGLGELVRLVRLECGLPPQVEAALEARVLHLYTAQSAGLTRPYPQAVRALEALHHAGHPMAICTNKFHAAAVQVLQDLNLARFFDVVIGGDSLALRKPDPAPLHAAFAGLGAERKIYIGDSEVDVETAHRAGVDFGLFTKGYRKTPVELLTKRFAFEDFADLAGHITEFAEKATPQPKQTPPAGLAKSADRGMSEAE